MPKVLCIEDEPDLLEDLLLELRDAGHEAVGTSSGVNGLAAIFGERFDVVICDIRLPELGGLELLREVKSKVSAEDLPKFFIMSAFSSDDLIKEAIALGAEKFIVKPIDYEKLIENIAEYLE